VPEVAVQSMHALPAEPQVVLLLLFGFFVQTPFASQQPSQFWGPHLAGLQEGAKATTKPTTAPSARALMFICVTPTAGNSADRARRWCREICCNVNGRRGLKTEGRRLRQVLIRSAGR